MACYRRTQTSYWSGLRRWPPRLYVLGYVNSLGPISPPSGCPQSAWHTRSDRACVSSNWIFIQWRWVDPLQGMMLLFMHELFPIGPRVHITCTWLKMPIITLPMFVRQFMFLKDFLLTHSPAARRSCWQHSGMVADASKRTAEIWDMEDWRSRQTMI